MKDWSPSLELSALADVADALVFVTEPTGRMAWTNQTFRDATGYGAEDFQFENPENPFLHREDAERVGQFLADFAASDAKQSEVLVNRFVDRWGGVHTYQSRVAKIPWNDSEAFLVVCRPHDAGVVGQHSAESQISFRELVEHAADGIVKLDQKGRLLFSNPSFRALVGRDAIYLGKHALLDLVQLESRKDFERAFEEVLRGHGPSTIAGKIVNARGETHCIQASLVRIDEVSKGVSVLAIVRDTTETTTLEARTAQAEKFESLGILAGGVAHDFNNLLVGMLTNAALAIDVLPTDNPAAAMLRDVRTSAERASTLSRQMLAYAGRSPLKLEEVDLAAIALEMKALLRAGLGSELRVSVEPGESGLWIHGGSAQLTQVVMNLAKNAAEAMQGGGCVRITAGTSAELPTDALVTIGKASAFECAWIDVADHGPGVEASVLQRMFDPFYSTKGAGRGLGLAAVSGIVQKHRGALMVWSGPKGTRIRVAFPLSIPPRREAPPVDEEQGVDRSAHVLVVDDEELVRRTICRVLEMSGYQVRAVGSGNEALALMEQAEHPTDLVLLDHTMPGLDGPTTRARLRELRPTIPIIMMSGWRELEDFPSGLSLAKPFVSKELLGAIRAGLRDASKKM